MKQKTAKKQTSLFIDNSKQERKQGAIIRKKGSKNLYVLFTYFDRRIEKSTGLPDTPENLETVRKWLDHVIELRDSGRLVFSEAFPGASESEKAVFAQLEGRTYSPDPKNVSVGKYIEHWEKDVLPLSASHTKREDYSAILKAWIRPYFAVKVFHDLTKLEVRKFLGDLKCKIGKNKGKGVSRSRAVNVLTVLRAIWEDAVDEFDFDLANPFKDIERHLPKKPAKKDRDIFRFEEWRQISEAIDPWQRPMIEFMMLTGMIHSEISGLQRCDIGSRYISVQRSIVRKVASDTLKTKYRARKIPITSRMRVILDEVLLRTDSQYVFADPNGAPYLREGFINRKWRPALELAGVRYRPPYSIRHSFAGWSLLIGIEPLRLVSLMGHGSKQMIFETYGNYLEGVEEDYDDILNYFGRDYVEYKRRPLSSYKKPSCESSCESQGLQ